MNEYKHSILIRMSAPEKLYCDNVNLMRSLVPRVDTETLRETFFVN